MQTLNTPRLTLRPWRATDLEPFAALNADPRVMEFMPAPLTRDESDAFAARIAAAPEDRRFGLWAVVRKSDQRLVVLRVHPWGQAPRFNSRPPRLRHLLQRPPPSALGVRCRLQREARFCLNRRAFARLPHDSMLHQRLEWFLERSKKAHRQLSSVQSLSLSQLSSCIAE